MAGLSRELPHLPAELLEDVLASCSWRAGWAAGRMGGPARARRAQHTPNLPTEIIPTKIR